MLKQLGIASLLIAGFVGGVVFVASCGGGGGVVPEKTAEAQDLTGVEAQLSELVAVVGEIRDRLPIQTAPPANEAPVINVNLPSVELHVGDVVWIDASGTTDTENDVLSFRWTFVDLPPGSAASVLNATVMNPSFVPDVAGNYMLRVYADDGVATQSYEVAVEVLP